MDYRRFDGNLRTYRLEMLHLTVTEKSIAGLLRLSICRRAKKI